MGRAQLAQPAVQFLIGHILVQVSVHDVAPSALAHSSVRIQRSNRANILRGTVDGCRSGFEVRLVEPALMTTIATWMIRHQLCAMVDLDRRRARRDLHLLPNQLPRHRVTVRVEDDHRIRVDDPGEFPRGAERRLAVECLELLTFRAESRQGRVPFVTERPMVGDRRHQNGRRRSRSPQLAKVRPARALCFT